MKIRNYLSVFCIVILIFFLYKTVCSLWQYKTEKEYYENFNQAAVILPEKEEQIVIEEDSYPSPKQIHWEQLQKKGKDIVAWIDILGIDVSYPIVWSKENNAYLRKNPEGKKTSSGSIILSSYNSIDFIDQNTILFGHNMKNGTMFGKLKWFMEKDAYEKSPYIWIYTTKESILYQIVSCYNIKISENMPDTYDVTSKEETEFFSWYEKQVSLSEKEMAWCKPNRMLTLSTCTGGIYGDEYRTILQATEIYRITNMET